MMKSDSPGEAVADEQKYEGEKVGEVTHFFGKISVAVIMSSAPIKNGDKIKIYDKEGNVVVEQEVSSMQIDGKDIEEVKAKTDFGMKVEGDVKSGYLVYKQ